jgi:hypothetical protein
MAEVSPVLWMTGVSAAFAAAAIGGGAPAPEVIGGMAGPVTAANMTWVLVTRTFRRAPERLAGLMTMAFAVKMVFFAVYVVAMLRGLNLSGTAFALSFAGFFIGVYAMEALFLQRLFFPQRDEQS